MKPAEIRKQWEEIGPNTDRLPVPGGWLIRSYFSDMSGVAVSQIFIADPPNQALLTVWDRKDP